MLVASTGRNNSSASPPIPLLLADTNCAALETIASVVRTSMPDLALRLCHSHSYAMHSLTSGCYQVVLCGARFAEVGDFLFLKQRRAFQPAVPILLIAERQDHDLVQRAMEQEEVEDVVVWPLIKEQLETSVRGALCLYRTRLTMADRQEHLSILRSGRSLPQKQTRRAIRRTETNVKQLGRVLDDCEREAQKRAIQHLDLLGRTPCEVSHR